MTDYQKTKIYKIVSHVGDKVYIGSTAKEYLSQRFQQHKKDYKEWKKKGHKALSVYEIFDDYGLENCQIVLIEEFSCNSKDAKNAREGYFIREFDCVNKRIEGRTKSEYYEDNKQKLIQQSKQYYNDNKEKISEKRKEIIACQCGCNINIQHKTRHERSKRHIEKLKIEQQNKSNQ